MKTIVGFVGSHKRTHILCCGTLWCALACLLLMCVPTPAKGLTRGRKVLFHSLFTTVTASVPDAIVGTYSIVPQADTPLLPSCATVRTATPVKPGRLPCPKIFATEPEIMHCSVKPHPACHGTVTTADGLTVPSPPPADRRAEGSSRPRRPFAHPLPARGPPH